MTLFRHQIASVCICLALGCAQERSELNGYQSTDATLGLMDESVPADPLDAMTVVTDTDSSIVDGATDEIDAAQSGGNAGATGAAVDMGSRGMGGSAGSAGGTGGAAGNAGGMDGSAGNAGGTGGAAGSAGGTGGAAGSTGGTGGAAGSTGGTGGAAGSAGGTGGAAGSAGGTGGAAGSAGGTGGAAGSAGGTGGAAGSAGGTGGAAGSTGGTGGAAGSAGGTGGAAGSAGVAGMDGMDGAGGNAGAGVGGVGGERNPSLRCALDQFVHGMTCRPCPLGTTREAGDDPLLGDTACETVQCDQNEAVRGNDCVPCAEGFINAPGDDASGVDTACDEVASPLVSCFDIERCRRECPEGAANLECRLACSEQAPREAQQLYQAVFDCLAREGCRTPDGAFDQTCANARCEDELDACSLTQLNTCAQIIDCSNECIGSQRQSCLDICWFRATDAAQSIYLSLDECLDESCPSIPGESREACLLAHCLTENNACIFIGGDSAIEKCGDLFGCVNACSEQSEPNACRDQCADRSQLTDVEMYNEIVECRQQNCSGISDPEELSACVEIACANTINACLEDSESEHGGGHLTCLELNTCLVNCQGQLTCQDGCFSQTSISITRLFVRLTECGELNNCMGPSYSQCLQLNCADDFDRCVN